MTATTTIDHSAPADAPAAPAIAVNVSKAKPAFNGSPRDGWIMEWRAGLTDAGASVGAAYEAEMGRVRQLLADAQREARTSAEWVAGESARARLGQHNDAIRLAREGADYHAEEARRHVLAGDDAAASAAEDEANRLGAEAARLEGRTKLIEKAAKDAGAAADRAVAIARAKALRATREEGWAMRDRAVAALAAAVAEPLARLLLAERLNESLAELAN